LSSERAGQPQPLSAAPASTAEDTSGRSPAWADGGLLDSASSDAAHGEAPEASAPKNDEVGLGIDIVDIDRMKTILHRTPSFPVRIFSEDERAYCDAAARPEAHYATRFAAKEAVLKALGTGFTRGIGPRDIEVKRNAKGQPHVALYGAAKRVADELGVVALPISLSFTHTEAVACAMAITRDSVVAERRRSDPARELTQQFKKMRGLLDELP
jgi:holo-[acyl-carrier protein] synthase